MTTTAAPASAGEPTEAEQRNSRTVTQMIESLNAHDVPGMLACFDDNMEWFDIPMETPYRGKEEIGGFLATLFKAIPDVRYDLIRMVTHGDHVVAQFRMWGTHRDTFYGLPGTDKVMDLPCLSMITMRNGKMLSDHCYFDNAMILRQLGLMPSLAVSLSPPGRAFLWLAVKRQRVLPLLAGTVGALLTLARVRRRQQA